MHDRDGVTERTDRKVRAEIGLRRNRRLAILVAAFCVLWVWSHNVGIFSDAPARIFRLSIWFFALVAIYSHRKLRTIEAIRPRRSEGTG